MKILIIKFFQIFYQYNVLFLITMLWCCVNYREYLNTFLLSLSSLFQQDNQNKYTTIIISTKSTSLYQTQKNLYQPPWETKTMSYFDWDNNSIRFTLLAYQIGHSPAQIHSQLYANGYLRLHLVTVEQCLRMNGYDIPLNGNIYYPEMNHGIMWNDLAHRFSFSAYSLGQSANQILQQLMQSGYNVILDQVVRSLEAQGFQGVRRFWKMKGFGHNSSLRQNRPFLFWVI